MTEQRIAMTNSVGVASFPYLTVMDAESENVSVKYEFFIGDNREDRYKVSAETSVYQFVN